MKILLIAGALLCWLTDIAFADITEAQNKSFYEILNQRSIEPVPTDMYLEKELSNQDQATLVANAIERAAKVPDDSLVMFHALFLASDQRFSDETKSWNIRLKTDVLAQAQNPNPEVRGEVVDLLSKTPNEEQKKLILSFLKDDDDKVRTIVLFKIYKWPDASSIYKKYIIDNQPEGKHKDSVICAKNFSDPIDSKRAELISDKGHKPHALEECSAYIALHKDDPDYEVSVRAAEETIKGAQADFNFDKSQEEYKEALDATKSNPEVIKKYGAIAKIEMDDWGNDFGVNGDAKYGQYGAYQFKLNGATKNGVIRATWDYKNYQFEITKIEEVSSDDLTSSLWTNNGK